MALDFQHIRVLGSVTPHRRQLTHIKSTSESHQRSPLYKPMVYIHDLTIYSRPSAGVETLDKASLYLVRNIQSEKLYKFLASVTSFLHWEKQKRSHRACHHYWRGDERWVEGRWRCVLPHTPFIGSQHRVSTYIPMVANLWLSSS